MGGDDISSIQTYDNLSGINMPNPSGIPGDDGDDVSLSVLDSREMISNEEFSEDEQPVRPVVSPSKPASPKIEEKKEESEPPRQAPKKSPSNIAPKVAPPKATPPKIPPVKSPQVPE